MLNCSLSNIVAADKCINATMQFAIPTDVQSIAIPAAIAISAIIATLLYKAL